MKSEIFQSLGLKRNPFPPGACKELYFHSEATKQALEELAYGVRARKGFMLLTGEVGYGKTSLLLQLMPVLEEQGAEIAWVFNTNVNADGLIRAVVRDFGLKTPDSLAEPASDSAQGKGHIADLVDLLNGFLMDKSAQDKNCVIVVDEAHNLEPESLESLRMLSNLELDGEKLVQILLVGQPELLAKLQRPELRQFRSRINIFLELPGLSLEETGNYVNFKLSAVGSQLRVEGQALDLVWRASAGCLRLINLIMEKALYSMVAMGEHRLSLPVVQDAVEVVGACHDDVAARLAWVRSRKRVRRTALAVGVLAVLALGLFLFLGPRLDASRESATTTVEQPNSLGVTQTGTPNVTQTVQAAPAPSSTPVAPAPASVDPAARTLNAAINAFLEPLGVMNLAMELRRGLENRDPDVLAGRLPRGLEVLSLASLPPGRDILYNAFPWKRLAGSGPDWLVLWRPTLRVASTHPDQGGQEVALLQEKLKDLGYYTRKVDGVFGPGTWDALRDFQAQYGLPASGQPDAQTRLWLVAVHEQSKDNG